MNDMTLEENGMTAEEWIEVHNEMYQYFQYLAWKAVEDRRAIEEELFAKEFDLLMEQRHGV